MCECSRLPRMAHMVRKQAEPITKDRPHEPRDTNTSAA